MTAYGEMQSRSSILTKGSNGVTQTIDNLARF